MKKLYYSLDGNSTWKITNNTKTPAALFALNGSGNLAIGSFINSENPSNIEISIGKL